MIKKVLIGPLSFALFPILVIYSHNLDQLEPSRLLVPIIYSMVLLIVSLGLSWAIFRNAVKASLFTSVWLLLFFSYGYIYLKLGELSLIQFLPLSLNKLLLLAYLVVFVGLGWKLQQSKSSPKQISHVLGVVGVVLVLLNLASILPFEAHRFAAGRRLAQYIDAHLSTIPVGSDIPLKPDIYYVVFDRYARDDVLADDFEYANEAQKAFFSDQGFFVADQANANYPNTFLSLSSSLNAEYLDFLPTLLGEKQRDRTAVYNQLIADNRVLRTLKQLGYQTKIMGSFWDPTKVMGAYDENINLFAGFDEFQLYIYERTLLNTLRGMIEGKQVYTGVERLERLSQNLSYQTSWWRPKSDQPQFVLAHFLMPHEPTVFAEDCRPLTFDEIRQQTVDDGYLRELNCSNQVMQDLVVQIEAQSDRPAVIIFQSDEGPYLPERLFGHTDYVYPESPKALKIHSAILNALYLPDRQNPKEAANYSQLGLEPQSSPVNTFRIIFNYYFDAQLPVYEDETYYFQSETQPYVFTNVTSQLQ